MKRRGSLFLRQCFEIILLSAILWGEQVICWAGEEGLGKRLCPKNTRLSRHIRVAILATVCSSAEREAHFVQNAQFTGGQYYRYSSLGGAYLLSVSALYLKCWTNFFLNLRNVKLYCLLLSIFHCDRRFLNISFKAKANTFCFLVIHVSHQASLF